MKEPRAWDMFNREIHINDRVQIIVNGDPVEGVINYIGMDDYIRVNTLAGEFRRKGKIAMKLLP